MGNVRAAYLNGVEDHQSIPSLVTHLPTDGLDFMHIFHIALFVLPEPSLNALS